MNEFGKVVLVGAGPGDLDLLTLKGKEYIEQADCIIYDRLLNKRMLSLAKSDCELIFAGKENHNHTLPQDEINEILYEKAKKYDLVLRLKGGDPYVFGRGGEEALYLKERGVTVEIIPGVSSSIAALADAGIPITHRGLSKGFQVITAHSRKDKPTDIDYTQLLDEDVTYVFLMGLSHVDHIANGLMDAGRAADTPAAVVSNGTTNYQKKVIGTLENIGALVAEAKLPSPAIIVVGKVVGLSEQLNFFEKRPFFGKKYFLPKLRSFNYSLKTGITDTGINDLEVALSKAGADILSVETGRIVPVDIDADVPTPATADDVIVFTSGNGVRSFFYNLFEKRGKDIRAIAGFKFAVVGDKTAEALKSFGVLADYVPQVQTGEVLAEVLNENVAAGANIHWYCGKVQASGFERTLDPACNLHKYISYENVLKDISLTDEQQDFIENSDGAIFTSGSNVKSVFAAGVSLPENIFSIGPSCTEVLHNYGVECIHEADEASYEGVYDLLVREI